MLVFVLKYGIQYFSLQTSGCVSHWQLLLNTHKSISTDRVIIERVSTVRYVDYSVKSNTHAICSPVAKPIAFYDLELYFMLIMGVCPVKYVSKISCCLNHIEDVFTEVVWFFEV